jgi:hypothetical protein
LPRRWSIGNTWYATARTTNLQIAPPSHFFPQKLRRQFGSCSLTLKGWLQACLILMSSVFVYCVVWCDKVAITELTRT